MGRKKYILLKLKNPWGKNDWSGNWSNYNLSWTEEAKSYFNYYNNNDDGTIWIDLNDFINYFDNTFICHLLYGELFKSRLNLQFLKNIVIEVIAF